TAPQSRAGSNERTCTMSGALPQSRFQVEERLAQLLAHLGLDQAHFAARLDNDWTGLVLRRPELVTSLTLVCPVYVHAAALRPLASPQTAPSDRLSSPC